MEATDKHTAVKVNLGQREQSSVCEILPELSVPQQQKEYWKTL